MEFKQFEGTTYQEWLDYHYKYSYKKIVDAHINNEEIMKNMIFGKIKQEKD